MCFGSVRYHCHYIRRDSLINAILFTLKSSVGKIVAVYWPVLPDLTSATSLPLFPFREDHNGKKLLAFCVLMIWSLFTTMHCPVFICCCQIKLFLFYTIAYNLVKLAAYNQTFSVLKSKCYMCIYIFFYFIPALTLVTVTVDAPSQAGYHGTVHHLYLFQFYFPEVILNMLFICYYYSICDVTLFELNSFCNMLTCTKK